MVSRPVILYSDIHALNILTKYQIPPLITVHPNDIETYFNGFVDASGSGYRISLQLNQTKGYHMEWFLLILAGMWGSDMSKYSFKKS